MVAGKKKLTKSSGSAFYMLTQNSIAIANHVFQNDNFDYMLPGVVLSTNSLEKMFR